VCVIVARIRIVETNGIKEKQIDDNRNREENAEKPLSFYVGIGMACRDNEGTRVFSTAGGPSNVRPFRIGRYCDSV